MKIYLIRHAEVDGKQITSEGHQQTTHLVNRHKTTQFDLLFSSNLHRAKTTAEALAKHHKKQVIIDERLDEITPRDGIVEESMRLESFFRDLQSRKAEFVGLICHGNVIRWFISKIVNTSLGNALKLEIYPCSTSLISTNGNQGVVIFVNEYSYIPKSARGRYFYGLTI